MGTVVFQGEGSDSKTGSGPNLALRTHEQETQCL